MARSPYAARKILPRDRRVLQPYTALAGEIVWAANSLHSRFLAIFITLLRDNWDTFKAHGVAKGIWHTLRSDDLQRAVLKATILETMSDEASITKSLLWALDAAGKLSEFRNDAVHTTFAFNKPNGKWEIEPNRFAGAPRRVEKLLRVGYVKLFRLLIGDLIQLRTYVDSIYVKMEWEPKNSLPKRPLLRSIQLVQKTPPKSSIRQSPRSTRKRQRRASAD